MYLKRTRAETSLPHSYLRVGLRGRYRGGRVPNQGGLVLESAGGGGERGVRARRGDARAEVRLLEGPLPDVVAALGVHDKVHEQGAGVHPDYAGGNKGVGMSAIKAGQKNNLRGSHPRKPNAAAADVSPQRVRAAAGVQTLHCTQKSAALAAAAPPVARKRTPRKPVELLVSAWGDEECNANRLPSHESSTTIMEVNAPVRR